MPSDPIRWVREYLRPRNGSAHQAHQFTLNGLTYPFVRTLNFAAVLDPPPSSGRRRLSHLTNLHAVQPGDLLYFYQADPQLLDPGETNRRKRRGIIGIYGVRDGPFRGSRTYRLPGFEIRGACATCRTPFAWGNGQNRQGPSSSGVTQYYCPGSMHPRTRDHANPAQDPFSAMTLSARLEIEPLFVFEFPVGDNLAYNFDGDPGQIVTGSVDNAMGAGKGSTIRHLLPEEAVKLTRLLVRVNGGSPSKVRSRRYRGRKGTIAHEDGVPVAGHYRAFPDGRVTDEMYLNLYASQTAREPSSLVDALADAYELRHLEFFCSELPWGYTNDEADFVISLSDRGGRYRLIILEFKRDAVGKEAAVQLMVYVPWVVQMLGEWCYPDVRELEVVPVLVGTKPRNDLVLPDEWRYGVAFNNGRKLQAKVRACRMLNYVVSNPRPTGVSGLLYGVEIDFRLESGISRKRWRPKIDVQRQDIPWLNSQWGTSRWG